MASVGLLTSLLLTVSLLAEDSSSDAEVLQQAEAAFHAGLELRSQPQEARRLFRLAAQQYELLRQHGANNAVLFRNQGNSYLLAGDVAQAILAYRRGLRLAPNDLSLRANLAQAREQVVYPEASPLGRPLPERLPPWLPRPRPWWVLLISVLLYSLGCISVTKWWMTRRGRLLSTGVTAFCLAAVASAFLMLQLWLAEDGVRHPLVVVARDGLHLRSGNGQTYPPRFATPVNRGVEGRLVHQRGSWLQIELAGGEIGWVPAASVLLDDLSFRVSSAKR
jgi:hypothetical protein